MAMAQKPRITLGSLKPLLNTRELDDEQFAPAPSRDPSRMSLDLIDEDPKQPRRQHDPVKLQELADSIKAAGDVLQPVSLYPNPDAPGRYIVNFGHRRCRAARMAGMVDVPYFLGRKLTSFDQVIENEQREDLSPMDLALFIRDRMGEGMQQQEIAQRLGKSKGYISKAAALAEAPAAVVEACSSGKVAGVNEAYELRNLHREFPEAVEQWVAQQPEISRASILSLRAELEAPAAPAPAPAAEAMPPSAGAPATTAAVEAGGARPAPKNKAAEQEAPAAGQATAARVLMGEYKGQPLVLDFSSEPPREGHIFGRRPGSPRRLTVLATDVRLLGFRAE